MNNLPADSEPLAYDFIIVGSGFGGSVSALRLAEKGFKVAILEQGKSWKASDFPKTNWNIRKYLWAPLIRCFGIQKITFLKGVMVLHGVGVGGGSLVYANTLMKPENEIFDSHWWPKNINWSEELNPCFELAKKMLGVTKNPLLEKADLALKDLAKDLGVAETFEATDVGVFFGAPGLTVSDPYFGGKGPERAGCIACGGCMVGCQHNAKNTLDKNYLYLAQKLGVKIFSETQVRKIIPQNKGFTIETKRSTSWLPKKGQTFDCKRLVLAAGVLGTMDLLLKNKLVHKTLPSVSDQLGSGVRTNGESLLGATSFDKTKDYSKGIAIGGAIHPRDNITIEAVRYPAGSGALRFLAVPLTENGNQLTRPLKLLLAYILRFPRLIRLWLVKDWAKSTIILLVMQSIDQRMKLYLKKSFFNPGGSLKGEVEGLGPGSRIPSFIPEAQLAAQILAKNIKGEAQNVASEVLFRTPATAHILGGCPISTDIKTGVVDTNHQVFSYSGLYICDGSVVPSNLGVNPSLTIAALAERFSKQF